MKTHKLVAGVALLFMVVITAAGQSGFDLFRDALIHEQEENLPEAIRLYERILKEFPSNRPLAARTLVQLGGAYEKRNDKERARATYAQITRDFAAEKDAFEEASRRLAGLNGSPSAPELQQRVALPEGNRDAYITPDGHFMTWSDTEGIWVRDLVLGQTKHVLVSGPAEQSQGATAGSVDTINARISALDQMPRRPILSPDNNWVVYVQLTVDREEVSQIMSSLTAAIPVTMAAQMAQMARRIAPKLGELRIMQNREGAESRILFTDPEYGYLEPAGWSADNKSVLVTAEKRDRSRVLAWISVDKPNTLQPLISLGWRFTRANAGLDLSPESSNRPRVSPDGKYVAYTALTPSVGRPAPMINANGLSIDADHDKATTSVQHIFVIRADGSGPETAVVQGDNINESPVWTSDNHILFVSNRSGVGFSMYSVATRDGKAAEPIVPTGTSIMPGRIRPVAMTDRGALYYLPEEVAGASNGSDVAIAQLDSVTGKSRGSVQRPVNNFVGRNHSPVWSPDGKSIAFLRQRPGTANGATGRLLVLFDLNTGREREYGDVSGTPLVWFQDGASLLVSRNGRLSRLDLASREFKPIEELTRSTLPEGWERAVPSRDGKTLFLTVVTRAGSRGGNVNTGSIVAMDLASGQKKTIWTLGSNDVKPSFMDLALSRDGRLMAINVGDRIITLGVDGSNPRVIAEFLPSESLNMGRFGGRGASGTLAWSPDDRSIYVIGAPDPSTAKINLLPGPPLLLRVPSQGGKAEPTGISVQRGSEPWFDLSPDGTRVALTESSSRADNALYVIDNFVSLLNATGKPPARN